MAEVALMRKKPVKDWVTRPNRKTGTILDNLYKQDTDIQDPSLPRAEPEVSEKISKKELRKAAIEEHDESLDLSPKRFYSTPNQDYSITNSQASNLSWKRKPAGGQLMDGKPKKARRMEESPSITSSSSLTPRVIKKDNHDSNNGTKKEELRSLKEKLDEDRNAALNAKIREPVRRSYEQIDKEAGQVFDYTLCALLALLSLYLMSDHFFYSAIVMLFAYIHFWRSDL